MADRCETCRFWERRGDVGILGPNCNGSVSNCRASKPLSVREAEHFAANVNWPRTNKDDWCGEYQPKDISQ